MRIAALHRVDFGFTLIEIMVVLTIMAILLASGVATYSRMNDRSRVEEAAVGLVSQLRAWQKDANVGVGSTDPACVGVYNGLSINWTETTVTANINCFGGVSEYKTYTLPNKAKTSTPGAMAFLALGRGTSANTSIVVQNTSATIKYTVTVSAAGGINVTKTP